VPKSTEAELYFRPDTLKSTGANVPLSVWSRRLCLSYLSVSELGKHKIDYLRYE